LIGKSHLQHGMSRNSIVPVDRTPTVDHGYGAEWDGLEHGERYEDGGMPDWPDDFYGFGHVELSIDHGARVSGHHLHWALDKGGRYEDLVVPYSPESPALQRSERWWQVYKPPYDEELHSTNFVTEQTIQFITDAAAADEPWYAWASFPDPHHPMTPPGRWYDKYNPDDMELPASHGDPLTNAPEYLRRIQTRHPKDQRVWVGVCGASDEQLVREIMAANYGTIEFIDDGVGRMMAAIDALGQLDNTIVVFTADHGDMMGDHGLLLKGFMPFRGTQQVPMLVVDPRSPTERAPGRTTALASSIDLSSTLMDLCDIPVHDGVQGRSLTPAMADNNEAVRDHVLIEDDLRAVTGKALKIPHRIRTVLTEDGMKYTRFSNGDAMLFDLVADPDEQDERSHTDVAAKAVADDRLVDAMMLAVDDGRGAPVG
jgi:arylsulfatase A-like enzyme